MPHNPLKTHESGENLLNSQERTGNVPNCSDTKSSNVQWGETDKVTYIKLRLRFRVVFFRNLHEVMLNRDLLKM